MPFGVITPTGSVRTFDAFVQRGFCVYTFDVCIKFAFEKECFPAKATDAIVDLKLKI